MSVNATVVIHPVPKAISIVASATPATTQEALVSIKTRLDTLARAIMRQRWWLEDEDGCIAAACFRG
jgi:hypothetical protein